MPVTFYDRHTGILGPGVPLPDSVASVAAQWEGRTGEPADLIREIEDALPGMSVVVDHYPGDRLDGSPVDFGMICLTYPCDRYPKHCWRVLKYKPCDPVE